MSLLNIPSTVDDPNYRYKMPRVKAKVEGRGNGIRTNITNMADVSRSLKRQPEYVTKFCGYELGSQSKYEDAEGKAIVNGAHQERDLQPIIDKFIDKFVLCPHCHLPEVDLVVKSKVKCKCNACGFSGDMDNTHKLATYIVKNPPSSGDSTMGKVSKKDKSARHEEKEKKSKKGDDDSSRGSEDAEKEKKEKKEDKEKKEKKPHKHHHKTKHGSDDGKEARKKDKEVDTDDEGVLQKEKLSFDSEEVEQLHDRLVAFIKKSPQLSPSDLFMELRLLQVSQEFDSYIRVYLSFTTLCCQQELTPAIVKQKVNFLKAIFDKSVTGLHICAGLEQSVERKSPSSWPNFGHVLAELYQADLLEEDAILSYFSQESLNGASYVHVKAVDSSQTFLKWLQAAETESSDEDSEDDSNDGKSSIARTDSHESAKPEK